MKIAYITLHKVRNYGSVLQAYATKRVLEKLGHDPVMIDYCSPRFVEGNRIHDEFMQFKYRHKNNPVIKSLFYMAMFPTVKKKKKVFEKFLKENIVSTKQYFDIEELRNDPPEADVYCTGSDQVWNFKTNGFFERPFYLDFGKDSIKRIAFSASFGRSALDDNELAQICMPLSRYCAIGVREMSGLSILEHLGIENRVNTLDPTLALEPSEWMQITSDKSPFKEKYILVYEFSKASNVGAYAKELSQKTGLPVKRITYAYHDFHKGEDCILLPSVIEFLNLIRHAEYVVTNSFHGTVFSTVFRKKFAAVYPANFSVRLGDYLRLTNMTERHVEKPEDICRIEETIDYDRVHLKLAEEREKTLLFLQKHIEGEV